MKFARPITSLPPIPVTLAMAAAMLWWMRAIIANAGPIDPPSPYPIIGVMALALALCHLLGRLNAPQPGRAAAIMLLMPSVLLNTGLAGPGDAFWVAPCVMAIADAIDRRHAAMLGWYGLALAFGAQALLLAPFFLALLINRRVPPGIWPIAPAVAAGAMLLAWAGGQPMPQLAMPPLFWPGDSVSLSSNAPNIWAIVQALPLGLPLLGLGVAAAIGATAAYVARFAVHPLGNRALLAAALLAPLTIAGLLPGMHERGFFLADILALALALVDRRRASWTIAILIQVGSTLAVLGHLNGIAGMAMLGGVAMMIATARLVRPLWLPAANDNPLMARTA